MANTKLKLDFLPTRIENQTDYFTITPKVVPVYNMVPTEKKDSDSEYFTGWLKVNVPSARTCRITALVDDNGSFTINGVTTEIAEGSHGSRRYTPEQEVYLEPGYYYVTCRVQDLKPLNESYSNVKHFKAFIKWDENGAEVTQEVTQLYNIVENGPRDVTIVITNEQVGMFNRAVSFPHLNEKADGSPQFYKAPVYKMILQGRTDSGDWKTSEYHVLRFMPGYNPNPSEDDTCDDYQKWTPISMTGLADTQSMNPTYIEYELHGVDSGAMPDDGAFVLTGSFYLHDGPNGEDDGFLWGAFGCCEVYGNKGMQYLKEEIASLSGIPKDDNTTTEDVLVELCSPSNQKLFVYIEGTSRPSVVEAN